MADLNIASVKVVVRSKFKYLTQNLDLTDILCELYTGGFITNRQYEHLTQEKQNKGATSQVELFQRYLLEGESENDKKKVEKFMELLIKYRQDWIYDELVNHRKGIEDGSIDLGKQSIYAL